MNSKVLSIKTTRDKKGGSGKEIIGSRKKVATQASFRLGKGSLVNLKLITPFNDYLKKHFPKLKAGTVWKLEKPLKKK